MLYVTMKHACLAILVLAAAARADEPAAVMRRFAPLILQHCHGRADYITRFDYDGNWNGRDNWQNLDKFPEPASVYASAIEGRSHWYLTYSFFHPRDWWPIDVPHINHENDLEGALVVVEKSNMRAIAMETIAHSKVLRWTSDAGLMRDGREGPLKFDGERPIVEIKQWKHPTFAYGGDAVEKEKGILYRFKGRAEVPKSADDHDCAYDVIDLHDSLWARRFDIGTDRTFGKAADFAMGRFGCSFNGDDYTENSADAPWYWGADEDAGLQTGDWFFDPAKALRAHFPGSKDRFSVDYVSNPYTVAGSRP